MSCPEIEAMSMDLTPEDVLSLSDLVTIAVDQSYLLDWPGVPDAGGSRSLCCSGTSY